MVSLLPDDEGPKVNTKNTSAIEVEDGGIMGNIKESTRRDEEAVSVYVSIVPCRAARL
jgi:hypothetical protein